MQTHKIGDLSKQYIKELIFGAPGSGKTSQAGSAALMFKTVFLSAEAGTLSLHNIKDKNGNVPDIDCVNIKSVADLEGAFNFLKLGNHDYKCVVIDSLTEIQRVFKDSIMDANKQNQLEMRGWGELAMKVERLVRAFRDLPMHVIVTALEDSDVDKLTGEVKVWPALQGSVQKQLPAYFDLVLYAFTKDIGEGVERKTTYNVLTQNSGKYIAKDRSGRLPQVIQDPSFGKIYDLIYNKNNKGETI